MLTRFAPSPSGFLHLGNVRAALFNRLAAAGDGGDMLLRLEDTDAARSEQRYIDAINEDLHWLGIRPRNGGDIWRQSRRRAEYERAFAALRARDAVYPCFCSAQTLAAARAQQIKAGKPPRYAGTCAHLPPAEQRARLDAGTAAAWRFRMTADVAFDDAVHGRLTFAAAAIGDFVIRRAAGDYAFLFANIADDLAAGITLVLRGDDHIANTPRQIALAKAMGKTPPAYGHMPLLTNRAGKPLAKRAGLLPLRDLRARGFLPAAVLNYLARVGHAYPPAMHDALMTADDLAAHFSIKRIGRAAAVHDEQQLLHWQKKAAGALSADEFRAWAAGGIAGASEAFCTLARENVVLYEDLALWHKALAGISAQNIAASLRAANITPAQIRIYETAAAHCDAADWNAFIARLTAATGMPKKQLLMPVRIALTGLTSGPMLPAVFAYFSAAQRKARFLAAAKAAAAE